jgi:serine/threonine protein kinase/tetratricopeptide (TPR) repeat protein
MSSTHSPDSDSALDPFLDWNPRESDSGVSRRDSGTAIKPPSDRKKPGESQSRRPSPEAFGDNASKNKSISESRSHDSRTSRFKFSARRTPGSRGPLPRDGDSTWRADREIASDAFDPVLDGIGFSHGDDDRDGRQNRPRVEPVDDRPGEAIPERKDAPPRRKKQPPNPRIGGMIAGFRIVAELGRGAFARVYLAEQESLSNRRVALKVSEALGDEPRTLARLQHAHIVPIHSVHDDPETGLRLLCMPYFGGANLARLLESSADRSAPATGGKTLVEALDRIGGRTKRDFDGDDSLVCVSLSSNELKVSINGDPSKTVDPRSTRPKGSIFADHGELSFWSGLRVLGGFRERSRRSPSLSPGSGSFPKKTKHENVGLQNDDRREGFEPSRQILKESSLIRASAWIAARLAEGLDHAHTRGILHRDLKPSNVLIAADGTPMLLDFNLAVDPDETPADRGERALIGGTLPYMSPEHLDAFNPKGSTDSAAVDARSDIYSLGLILFEMIVGELPFADRPDSKWLDLTLREMTEERRAGAPSPRACDSRVPWSLDSIVSKCLEPDPARRYARAGDLADDLNRFLDDRPLRFAPDPSIRERIGKWARRNPKATSWTTVSILSVCLLLIALSIIHIYATNLKRASARIDRSAFQKRFNECQILLNTQGPTDHQTRGIEIARRALAHYHVETSDNWTSEPGFALLPRDERSALREEIGELLMLLARSEIFAAQREGTEADRLAALERGIRRLDVAERTLPYRVSALYEDRSRYQAAIGNASAAKRDRTLRDQTPPSTPRDYYLLGTAYLARREPLAAESALQKAIDLDPKRLWPWFALGVCRLDQQRYLEAAGDFGVCIALDPSFDWPHLNRGLALARAGRTVDAKREYDRAIALNPRFVEALIDRALVNLELDDPSAVEADLRRAIKLGENDPKIAHDPAIQAALAEAISRQGRADEADALLSELIERNPNRVSIYIARGYSRMKDPKRMDLARGDFESALAIDSRAALAHLGLAYLVKEKDPAEALREVEKALDREPGGLDAIQLHAILLARLGRSEAIAEVERLLEAPNPVRLYNAACALAILSKTAADSRLVPQALDLLKKSVEMGVPVADLSADGDLEPLRDHPQFLKIAAILKSRRASIENRRRETAESHGARRPANNQ